MEAAMVAHVFVVSGEIHGAAVMLDRMTRV
jgi:hypothetical protein